MDIERLRQIEEIYYAAQACEPKERALLLDRTDPDVKGEVELLLAQSETWLDRPAREGVTKTALQELAAEQGASQREIQKPVLNIASLPGAVLDGKYKIERQLDKGGMGAVFLAIHLGTTRTVAVKVIVPRLASQDEFLRRFQREAQAAGRLRHPNVVNVTDFGAALLGHVPLAYLVMEFLDGQNLAHFLKENPRPAADEILDIVDQVALALDAAHESGVVHRDLKPDNIWLQPNHRGGFNVKVLDFGIAKLHDSADAGSADLEAIPALSISAEASTYLETTAGSVLGTPAYMAPEQCRGTDVDARADIYSLSVIVYQMFCGCLPFNAKGLRELLQKQIEELPTPPMAVDPGISRRVSQTIMEGLAKDPASRPPSASAFAAQLRAASEGELKPLAEGKIIANNYGNCFFPMLLACFAPYIPVMGGLYLGARAIPGMAAVPSLVVGAVFQILIFAAMFFLSQIYKAGCDVVDRRCLRRRAFSTPVASPVFETGEGIGLFGYYPSPQLVRSPAPVFSRGSALAGGVGVGGDIRKSGVDSRGSTGENRACHGGCRGYATVGHLRDHGVVLSLYRRPHGRFGRLRATPDAAWLCLGCHFLSVVPERHGVPILRPGIFFPVHFRAALPGRDGEFQCALCAAGKAFTPGRRGPAGDRRLAVGAGVDVDNHLV